MSPFYEFEGTNLLSLIKSKVLSTMSFKLRSKCFDIIEIERTYQVIIRFEADPSSNVRHLCILLNQLFKSVKVQTELYTVIGRFADISSAKEFIDRDNLNEISWLCDSISIYKRRFTQGKFIVEEIESMPLTKRVGHALTTSNLDNHFTYKYEDGEWRKIDSIRSVSFETFSLISYNVLFDIYQYEETYVAERRKGLMDILSQSDVDIIALQEVTVSFLEMLVKQAWVQEKYYISTSLDDVASLEPYGQLFLSKFPFAITHNPFTTHKRTSTAEFSINDKPFFIVNLHLPSFYKNEEETMKLKKNMVRSIEKTLSLTGSSDCLILGDFNFMDESEVDSIIDPIFIDSWTSLYPNNQGFTFDIENNTIAQILTKKGLNKRFDRIYYHSQSSIVPQTMRIIGDEGWDIKTEDGQTTKIFPSDHYGLWNTFKIDDSKGQNPTIRYTKEVSTKFSASDELYQLLISEGVINDEVLEDTEKIYEILDELHKAFFGSQEFLLIPVGSAALKVRSKSSDIDLLCVSRISPDEYFLPINQFFGQKKDIIRHKRYVKNSLIPVMEINVLGTMVDIQYHQEKGVLTYHRLLSQKYLKQLDKKSLMVVKSFVDSQIILSYIPSMPNFRLVYQYAKQWAANRGLYSNRLGFFGGYGLSILVAKVCYNNPNMKSIDILKEFFKTYATWNWDKKAVILDPTKELAAEPHKINILTASLPFMNSTRNSTNSTKTVLVKELSRAYELTSQGKLIEALMPLNIADEYKSYLVLNVSAAYPSEHYLWSNFVESQIVDLISRLERNSPVIIHPIPTAYDMEDESMVSTFYLLGLTVDRENRKGQADISPIVKDFVSKLLSWSDFQYGMHLDIKHKKASTFGILKPFEYNFVHMEEDHQDELYSTHQEDDSDQLVFDQATETKQRHKNTKEISNSFEKKERFRTSEEAYNQIRWDPKFDVLDFIVGYEDRFVGIIEVPYLSFRSDPEIFIPWHRVWYFKRRGIIVWDRKNRVDLLAQMK